MRAWEQTGGCKGANFPQVWVIGGVRGPTAFRILLGIAPAPRAPDRPP